METKNLNSKQFETKQNRALRAPRGSDDVERSKTQEAWESYYALGQLIENTTDAGLLADIEFWAKEIAEQAKTKSQMQDVNYVGHPTHY